MLGVFLLPSFTRGGHECQDLLCPCVEIHVCTGSFVCLCEEVRSHKMVHKSILGATEILIYSER